MAFEYTLRSFDIPDFAQDTQIRVEERDKELETYTLSIDTSFLNLNASNLTSGTVPSARVTGSYTGITDVGTLSTLAMSGSITGYGGFYNFGTFPSDLSIYLGTNTAFGNVNIQFNSTTKLSVGSAGIVVTGSVVATSFAGTITTAAQANITSLGTLTGLTVDGPSSPSFTVGDWSPAPQYSGITGNTGYLLVGTNAVDTAMYLRTSTAGAVNIGANNSNTLAVGNGSATVSGTLTATTFSGSGASLTSIPAGQLTGTVASARISGAYTGFSSITTSSTITSGGYHYISTAGQNYLCQSPTTGAGNAAHWVAVLGTYHLYRNTSTIREKENIQSVGNLLNPNMIDAINIQLWNRKTAPGIPEVGPMAEEMDAISPFLSTRGLDMNENGEYIPAPVDGINSNSWLSLLTIGMQDIRQRLQQLETT